MQSGEDSSITTDHICHGAGGGSCDVDGSHQDTVLSVGERQPGRMDAHTVDTPFKAAAAAETLQLWHVVREHAAGSKPHRRGAEDEGRHLDGDQSDRDAA